MRATTILAGLLAAAVGGCGDDRDARPPLKAPVVRSAPAEPEVEEEPPADAGPADAGPTTSPLPPGKPMLLEFTRDHCLPCEIMAPWMKELRKEHAGRVQILEINIDRKENKPLARYFKARSIPTQVYVDARGREVSRHVGLATKPQMQRTMKRHGFLSAAHDEHDEPAKKKKKRKRK
jgi:thioredoxin 1